LVLSDEERTTLLRWSRRAKSSQALALRCRIVLASAKGANNKEGRRAVALRAGHRGQVAGQVRAERLDGLVDEDRPGRPASITIDAGRGGGGRHAEETPKDATHWSRALMGQQVGAVEVHDRAHLA